MAEFEYKYAPPDVAYVVYGDGLSHCRVRCVEVLRECDELDEPAYLCRFIDKGSKVAVRDILGGNVTHKIFYEEELMGEREAREKALRKLKEYRDVMQAEIEDINRRMALFYDKSTDCCIIDVEAGPWATALGAFCFATVVAIGLGMLLDWRRERKIERKAESDQDAQG